MVKVAKTLEQNHEELRTLTAKTFERLKADFDAKNCESVRYLNGELDDKTSDEVVKILEEAGRQEDAEIKKGNGDFEPDLEKMFADKGLDIVMMESGIDGKPNIPDFVVKKKGATDQNYLALIELARGIIEIKDASIEQEMMTFAQEWEKARQTFEQGPGFNLEHFGFVWSDEVIVYNLS